MTLLTKSTANYTLPTNCAGFIFKLARTADYGDSRPYLNGVYAASMFQHVDFSNTYDIGELAADGPYNIYYLLGSYGGQTFTYSNRTAAIWSITK